ncbi:Uncharacterised protein [Escherichia coli]|nr:Uncharacterised protein [Escherichia coli]CTY48373.1 Uncharacterised protein [Escherichia coli]CTZ52793.1 Uncharacterised protein [Escherichia coli]
MTRSMTITGGGGLLHIPRFHFITPVILNTVRPAGVRHPGHAIETDPLTELPDRAGHQTDITTAQAFIMEGIFTRLHRVTFLHRCITQRDNAAQVIRELITVFHINPFQIAGPDAGTGKPRRTVRVHLCVPHRKCTVSGFSLCRKGNACQQCGPE